MSSHKKQRIQRESVSFSGDILEWLYQKERKKNEILNENVCKNIKVFDDN